MTPKLAYTVGYQGVDRSALIAALVSRGVTTLIDTRETPMSRKPDYRKRVLAAAMADAGIDYEWMPALGVPRESRPLAKTDWPRFERDYQDRVSQLPPVLDAVVALGWAGTIAFLCFEAEERECHRLPLSDIVASRSSLRFEHLHVGRVEHADDHPVAKAMVRPQDQV